LARGREEGSRPRAETRRGLACGDTCSAGVADVTGVITRLLGAAQAASITSVPCGHSGVPNCLGRRLAEGVAAALGVTYVQIGAEPFVKGVSHPKEFGTLPQLEWIARPDPAMIVINDVATSGWHLEEALTALRGAGVEATGIAWIGGTRGTGSNFGKPEAPRSVFGASAGGWSRRR